MGIGRDLIKTRGFRSTRNQRADGLQGEAEACRGPAMGSVRSWTPGEGGGREIPREADQGCGGLAGSSLELVVEGREMALDLGTCFRESHLTAQAQGAGLDLTEGSSSGDPSQVGVTSGLWLEVGEATWEVDLVVSQPRCCIKTPGPWELSKVLALVG